MATFILNVIVLKTKKIIDSLTHKLAPARKRQSSEPLSSSSKVPNTGMLPGRVEASFEVSNDGSNRHEIEVALVTLNGNKFIGSITPQEAKFSIYKECLGFNDFSNFDGVRFAYRGSR